MKKVPSAILCISIPTSIRYLYREMTEFKQNCDLIWVFLLFYTIQQEKVNHYCVRSLLKNTQGLLSVPEIKYGKIHLDR